MDPATPLQPYSPPPVGGQAPPAQGPSAAVYPSVSDYPANQVATQAPPTGQPFLQPVYRTPADPVGPVGPVGPPQNDYGQPLPEQAAPPNIRHELVERLRTANNVLVTVSNNPSVDQLSAAIGLTLVLNKLDKHATAVYSGKTPSAIEFLQPNKTLEKNTDSLRDFIIALDKAKADKLRYKVEDKFVKIFITPYHTSLTENDLEFSQGDFNVDVVVAIGVHKREELDEAITAHGRILHDAVTASVNNKQNSDLGTINWFEPDSSSLCEMVVSMIEPLQGDKALLDEQIATAFLTGVVAETDRFSNEKTSPHTMNIAATLMKAGANQQLVSSKLEAPEAIPEAEGKKLDELAKEPAAAPTVSKDGSLAISHTKDETPQPATKTLQELENENRGKHSDDDEEDGDLAKIHIDDEGKLSAVEQASSSGHIAEQPATPSNMIMQPPSLGGDLSSTMRPEAAPVAAVDEPPTDLTQSAHAKTIQPLSEQDKSSGQTLAQIEETVGSPHVAASQPAPLDLPPTVPSHEDVARQAVNDANNSVAPTKLEPISALNAQPVDLGKNSDGDDSNLTTEEVFPPQLVGPDRGLPPDPTAGAANPGAPPPVPPPLVPPVM